MSSQKTQNYSVKKHSIVSSMQYVATDTTELLSERGIAVGKTLSS